MTNIPKIDININGVEYPNTFQDDVMIDRTNLDEEFSTQAEKFAYYGFIAVEAKSVVEFLKLEVEQSYARIDHEKRAAAEGIKLANKGFKYTEKMCENEVITDDRYTALKHKYLSAKLLADQLDVGAKAIAQRRDMLQQLGANDRQSMTPQRALDQKADAAHEIITQNRAQNAVQPPPSDPQKTNSRRKPKSA